MSKIQDVKFEEYNSEHFLAIADGSIRKSAFNAGWDSAIRHIRDIVVKRVAETRAVSQSALGMLFSEELEWPKESDRE